jgi:hypothetical protein
MININRKATIELFDNPNGREYLMHLKDILWNLQPHKLTDSNAFIYIDGQRQLVRMIEKILTTKEENKEDINGY